MNKSLACLAALAAALALPAGAQSPTREDAALGEAMAHCSAVLYEVWNSPPQRRLAMTRDDANALMRYTMLATAAIYGDDKGLPAVKERQSMLRSKLGLTRPENIRHLLDAEASQCIRIVEDHKEELSRKLARVPPAAKEPKGSDKGQAGQ